MPNLKRNFIRGRMNKSLDERLVPQGEYVDAMNVRLGSTENSEIGSVENTKGNTALTDIEVNGQKLSTSAKCIGAFEDGARETIYWFVTDHSFPVAGASTSKCDLILSYNVNTSLLTYHIISINDGTGNATKLNFNSKYLITGIDIVDDLLFFTDDYNPPRRINIKQSYPVPTPAGPTGIDGFIADDILVIKAAPIQSPLVTMINVTGDEDNNYLEDRFICFAYRYKYENGEYSATSPFSDPAFVPSNFGIDPSNFLNVGMTNLFNVARVQIYTGDSLVKGIDLLFKEANETTIRVIQKLDKLKDGIPDQAQWSFDFDNSKVYTVLSSSEILRLYDNVPRFAKAQSIMGNRLMYGNYVDGYDLIDDNNNAVLLNYIVNYKSKSVGLNYITGASINFNIPQTYGAPVFTPITTQQKAQFSVDLAGQDLKAGSILTITVTFKHGAFVGAPVSIVAPAGSFTATLYFVLSQDYASVFDMITSNEWENAIGTNANIQTVPNSCNGATFTDNFNCACPNTQGSTYVKTASGITQGGQTMLELINPLPGATVAQFTLLGMFYVDTASVSNFYETYEITNVQAELRNNANSTSLHSDRGYELGIVYLDEYARATTALVSKNNDVYVPCNKSHLQNTLVATIPTTQHPPSWAEYYRFVIKSDTETYETIYASQAYPEDANASAPAYWLRLEGQNAAKIENGDKLRVKSDFNGAIQGCVFTTVLEKGTFVRGFIEEGVSGTSAPVPPVGGVYMKIKPKNFTLEAGSQPQVSYTGNASEGFVGEYATLLLTVNDYDQATNAYIDEPIPQGSRVVLFIDIRRYQILNPNNINQCDENRYVLTTSTLATNTYATFEDYWMQEIEPILNTGTCTVGQYSSCNANQQEPFSSGAGNPVLGVDYNNQAGVNQYQFWRDTGDNKLILRITSGTECCAHLQVGGKSTIDARIFLQRSDAAAVFETMPIDSDLDLFYEGSETFRIKGGLHQSGSKDGDQNQSATDPAIVNLDFFNCYSFGNGVESYRIEDSLVGATFNIGNRATAVSAQDYKEADRFADITYSGVYNDESNVNKLNEFNLGLANFLPLEDSFGSIEILHARATDLLVLQEDRISYVTVGKNILTDAVGGGTVTSIPEVLGQQVARLDEYGISNNPESFVVYGYDKFFTDSKRGAVLRLSGSAGQNEQLTVLSEVGMRGWFRDLFIDYGNTQKLGGFDPYMNEYVLSSNTIKLPVLEECIQCGIIQNLNIPEASEYTFCVDLTTVTGTVNIPYTFAVGSSGTIAATYNAVTSSTGVVSGSGTLSFSKNSPAVTTVSIVITPTGGAATLRLSVDCPTTTSVKVIQVCVTSNVDNAQMIHNEFGYVDAAYTSPTNSTAVTFVAGTTNPLISQYDTFNGVQGDSICPTNGSTVRLTSQRLGFDNFTFDTSTDKFRYLRTNTVYSNNPVDVAALIAASTQALPLVTTGAPNAYYAEFTMPGGTDEILYLIYDYRNSLEHDLCYDAASVVDVCCVCTHHWYLMRNSADSNEEYVALSPVALVIGTYYTLINQGAKCFEVISTSTTPPTENINTTCTP